MRFLFLLLAISLSARADEPFRSGDVLKFTVEVDDTSDFYPLFSKVHVGSAHGNLVVNPATRRLETLVEVPRFNRERRSEVGLELYDRAHNHTFVFNDNFARIPLAPIPVDSTAPQIRNVRLRRVDSTTLRVNFDVLDEQSGFRYAWVSITGELESREDRTNRLFIAHSDPNIRTCRGTTHARCQMTLKVPERIPGVPALSINAVDIVGNNAYATSHPEYSVYRDRKPDFDFAWPSRGVRDADVAKPAVDFLRVDSQKGNEVTVHLWATGVDNFSDEHSGLQYTIGRGETVLTAGFERRAFTSLGDHLWALTFTLPTRLPSRDLQQIRGYLSGANEQSQWFDVPTDGIDLTGITVDNTPPRFLGVEYHKATTREIRDWTRAQRARQAE